MSDANNLKYSLFVCGKTCQTACWIWDISNIPYTDMFDCGLIRWIWGLLSSRAHQHAMLDLAWKRQKWGQLLRRQIKTLKLCEGQEARIARDLLPPLFLPSPPLELWSWDPLDRDPPPPSPSSSSPWKAPSWAAKSRPRVRRDLVFAAIGGSREPVGPIFGGLLLFFGWW